MQLLDDYLALQRRIYDYFGYTEQWRVLPIDDRRAYYWSLPSDSSGEVHYSGSEANHRRWVAAEYNWDADGVDGHDCYSDEIYTYTHLPRYVYRGPEYTMVCVDTHVDGNKLLAIFDNAKEITG